MNAFQIQILLLFLISFSAVFVTYFFYMEYKKFKHLSHIKDIISLEDDDATEILASRKSSENVTLLSKIKLVIKHTGFEIPVSIFIFIFFLVIGTSGSLFTLFLQHWFGYIVGIPFGVLIYYMVLKTIIVKRKKEFNKALAIAISVLVKMMKNGIGFEQALSKSISVSGSLMFKEIFSTFFQEKNAIGEEEAFRNLNDYVNSKELSIFALAIKIGRESGGQFSNTLEKVEKTINYRKKMQEKVDVVTREATVGSYIVVAISIFLYFSLNGNFDGKMHHYFMTSEYGRFQLLAIGMWIFVGMVVNKLITRVDK